MNQPTSTRRDPRFTLDSGVGGVSFAWQSGGTVRAGLTTVSVAGISFRVPSSLGETIERGSSLTWATVRVGRCSISGSLTVVNVKPVDDGAELGCLFVPGSDGEEARWMALLEGIEAARSGSVVVAG